MSATNQDTSKENLIKAQQKVIILKEQMHKNIDLALKRGNDLDDLVQRSDELNQGAIMFDRDTRQLKNKMWWKNIKMYLMIGGIIVVILIIIISIAVIMSQHTKNSKSRRLDSKLLVRSAQYLGNNCVEIIRIYGAKFNTPILKFPFESKKMLRGSK
jgi:flagellar biosynthesis/type III secretory pathway M-ring protein FliF/YscJ